MIGIYKITNKINGNSYIGKSNNIKRRFFEHKNIKKESNQSLKKAYIKYGIENFTYEILEECSLDKLNEREIHWISKLKPKYNRTLGGDGTLGKKISKKQKSKFKKIGKNIWNNLSEETKRKIIENNLTGPAKGHKVSKETREKISKTLKKRGLLFKQSQETINKRKQTMLLKKQNGYIQTNASHKKKVLCIETGEIFNSVKEAGIKNNVDPSSISGVLKGRYKTCKGKHYQYYKSVTTNRDECNGVE